MKRSHIAALGVALAIWNAPARAADVFVGVPPFNPDPGQQFTIEISIDVGADVLGSYFVHFLYDPAVVQVISIGGGASPQFAAAPTSDPTSFAIGLTPLAGSQGSMVAPTGNVSVARITLGAVGAAGSASDLDLAVLSLFSGDGLPLPTSVFASSVLVGFDPALDPDLDGLTNQQELAAGTGFLDPDTDGDGLEDGFEVLGGLDPLSADPPNGPGDDPDADGLVNSVEQTHGCNPTDADTDVDNLGDDQEVALGTLCSIGDSDGDTLFDGFEVGGGLDPLDDGTVDPGNGAVGDPDADDLTNAEEQGAGTDPTDGDTDGDGLPDGFEVNGGLDPLDDGSVDPANGAGGDPDADGLTNAQELVLGTNPTNGDTDGDGLPDDYEAVAGLDATDDGSVDPDQGAAGDPDGDGHQNLEEFTIGSDPQDFRSRPISTQRQLSSGFLLLSYALADPTGLSSFDLFALLSDENGLISRIQGIDDGVTVLTAQIAFVPSGDDFAVSEGVGVMTELSESGTATIEGEARCLPTDLVSGVNIVGLSCTPIGYGAFQMLADIGTANIVSAIQRFDPVEGRFETALYVNRTPSGTNFSIEIGESYLVHMLVDLTGFDPLN